MLSDRNVGTIFFKLNHRPSFFQLHKGHVLALKLILRFFIQNILKIPGYCWHQLPQILQGGCDVQHLLEESAGEGEGSMAFVIKSHPKQGPNQEKSVVVAWHLTGEPDQPGGEVAEGTAPGVAEGPGGDSEELPGRPATILPFLALEHHLRARRHP